MYRDYQMNKLVISVFIVSNMFASHKFVNQATLYHIKSNTITTTHKYFKTMQGCLNTIKLI
jgi:hypothetical protein